MKSDNEVLSSRFVWVFWVMFWVLKCFTGEGRSFWKTVHCRKTWGLFWVVDWSTGVLLTFVDLIHRWSFFG